MKEIKELKHSVCRYIDENRDCIINLGKDLYAAPETGFREYKTSELLYEKIQPLVSNIKPATGIPGFKATFDSGKKGPGVALLAELDSIICGEHPDSSSKTGAVHACGHNMQMAAVFGAALGMKLAGISEKLAGRIHFIFVPAEEYIEIDFRMKLREQGKIRYLGGKPEFMSRGFFDDVDMSLMFHARPGVKKVYTSSSLNGCLIKKIRYIGKPAHAGGAPEEGINALYAANLGLNAINARRETFREDQYIRVHPIITKGGEIVNVIPSDVRIETFIRGKTVDDIKEANMKIDMALAGGAVAIGSGLEIEDIPGYFPVLTDQNLMELAEKEMESLCGKDEIGTVPHSTGSTDIGDLSSIMPVIHPYIGGVAGGLHSAEFRIEDEETAYVLNAKMLACIAIELLRVDRVPADSIIRNYQPHFSSMKKYFEYIDSLFKTKVLNERYGQNVFDYI